ncbi:MAG: T9SS type A sorting domain-containing protein [Chitinophagaceae bacterium]|nr:MAG: T9SS type A sorting domain-containing protein [Chitinophagaceae bacterium]
MNKVLPTTQRSLLSFIAVSLFTLFFQAPANAQANLLSNGSFETPAMSIFNLNNIIGVGNTWGGWNCTNGGFNILRLLGSGYNSGANHASDGNQYVDVASTDGWISQSFVLDHASPITFGGDFSSREAGWSNYVNWTARVEIVDSNGTVVATSPTRNFVTTDNMETWYTLTGSTSTLPAGSYTYRAYAGNSGHFDNAVVSALSGQVLAVKLIDFNTVSKNNQLISSWTVSYEENVNGYELEGSQDGSNFSKIRFIAAQKSGKYSVVNRRPANHTDYYRLKVINGTGVPTYSKIISLKEDQSGSMAIFPNPATNKFSISLDANLVNATGTLSLVNAGGQVIRQEKFAKMNATESVDISSLSPGTYFVRVAAGENVMMKPIQVMHP